MPHPENRALLVVATAAGVDAREESEELSELAAAAGYFGAAVKTVKLRRPNAATYLNSGAIDGCKQLAEDFAARQIIVGADLSSVQARNLEKNWKLPVIDRTDLILNIFGVRAKTGESKLQVELARCRRQMGRLAGRWSHLERQRGGIGVRGGPGEKQLEIDRRLLAQRSKRLELQIEKMSARNVLARRQRARGGALSVALVGHTNAGKSTLFNALTRAGAPANDRLFDTLESTARRMFADGEQVVVADTVGFIRKLPHELLAGFRATLQEAAASDVVILVADASRADCDAQLDMVGDTLDAIGATGERLTVFNKIDKVGLAVQYKRTSCGTIRTIWLSGRRGDGVSVLRDALTQVARRHKHVLYLSE
ncbi:MAG: GTPase HflX [Gammaproteobacteria bacterium]